MATKKLTLSSSDKMLAGVCGGLAAYFSINSTVVRIVYALLSFFTAIITGVIVYLILWLIMSKK